MDFVSTSQGVKRLRENGERHSIREALEERQEQKQQQQQHQDE